MKKHSILFSMVLFCTWAFAGNGLMVTQKLVTGKQGQSVTVSWYVTQSQCKLKMQYSDKDVNTNTFFIPDAGSMQLLTYSDGAVPAGVQKSYFTIPVGAIKGSAASAYTVERTGEIKDISGVKCEKMLARNSSTTIEMWVTKDFTPDFYRFTQFFQSNYELKALNDAKIPGFPIASVTRDLSGKVISSYEPISAATTDIADAEFKVPSEYANATEANKAKK